MVCFLRRATERRKMSNGVPFTVHYARHKKGLILYGIALYGMLLYAVNYYVRHTIYTIKNTLCCSEAGVRCTLDVIILWRETWDVLDVFSINKVLLFFIIIGDLLNYIKFTFFSFCLVYVFLFPLHFKWNFSQQWFFK